MQERYRQTPRFDDYREGRRRSYDDQYRDGYSNDHRGMSRDDAYRDVRRDFYDYDDPRGRGDYDRDGAGYGRQGYDRGQRAYGDENDNRGQRPYGDEYDGRGRRAYGDEYDNRGKSSFDDGYDNRGAAKDDSFEPSEQTQGASYDNEDRRGNDRRDDMRNQEPYYRGRDERYSAPRDNMGVSRAERGRDSYGDSFQSQLDSFRDKAKQLQEIIDDKQDRVDYLERSLADVNERNRILEEELVRSRQETGDAAADIEEQVNRLSEILGKDIEGMEQRLAEHITEIPANLPGEMQEVSIDTEFISRGFDEQSKRMEDVFSSISEKLEEIIDLQKNAGTQSFDEVFADQKSFLSNAMLSNEKKISESLNGVSRQVEGMKDELSEKIHSEDVKVYRNIQDFITEQDHFEEAEKDVKVKYKWSKWRDVAIIILTVVDIILGFIFLGVIM